MSVLTCCGLPLESDLTQTLDQLIKGKLNTLTRHPDRVYLQREIKLLERIAPLVARATTIVLPKIHEYVDNSIMKSAKLKCDGVLFYIPIKNVMGEKPCIAIANPVQDKLVSFINDDITERNPFGHCVSVYPETVRITNLNGCFESSDCNTISLED